METAASMAPQTGAAPLCAALGLPRSSYYRRQGPQPAPKPRPKPARALSQPQRQEVLDMLHSERFVDRSPAEVVPTLAEEDGVYLCSVRTMYRILVWINPPQPEADDAEELEQVGVPVTPIQPVEAREL